MADVVANPCPTTTSPGSKPAAPDAAAGGPLRIVIVSGDHTFANVVSQAIGDVAHPTKPSVPTPWSTEGSHYVQVLERARDFVHGRLDLAATSTDIVDNSNDLPNLLLDSSDSSLGGPQRWSARGTILFVIDAQTAVSGGSSWQRQERVLAQLDSLARNLGIGLAAYSVLFYDKLDADRVYARTDCTVHQRPSADWVLATEIVMALTDLVEARHLNSRAMLPGTQPPLTLAVELARFLDDQSAGWGLHYFTGSIVAWLIEDLSDIATRGGNPVLRGPNEHSLACGAFARWQLQGEPYVLVATSGMVDELRGTLANLRSDRARGFLVFAEAQPDEWYPFQGTIHANEDAREVFAARGVPCFYLHDPASLGSDLGAAFAAYQSGVGPVVLLVGPAVLQHNKPIQLPVASNPARSADDERVQILDEDPVAAVATALDHAPIPVLWQCGPLNTTETELVYDLARRAGIALADAVTRPGTVAAYHAGQPVDEYLGTLTLYGFSPAVWQFLSPGGKLRPRDQLELLFLNTAIADLDTPFPAATLANKLHITQVNEDPGQIAPFTDRAIRRRPEAFLRRLADIVDPDPEVRQLRARAIAEARRRGPDPLEVVPSVPMHPEYFLASMNRVFVDLIERGWTYTGVYDVGRGALSAIRDLPRTGPGFSGWYGRALMGDALSALPALAFTHDDNIVAFVGDGASQLVPSILPTIRQRLCYERARFERNLTIFHLVNGGFSIIRTYRELYQAATSDTQMSLLTEFAEPWQVRWGDVTVQRERIIGFDPAAIGDLLSQPRTINLLDVHLAHNNANMGPLATRTWRIRS